MQSPESATRCWSREARQPSIAIIGAGMSGIAAVVELRKAGYTDVTVYEKADRVGGTWRENTYPGLSCDVPSRWYSFRFAPNPDWTHRFSYGPEIQAYMEKVADDFGVTGIVRFHCPVVQLEYEAPTWLLTTASGERKRYDIVISATGILHKPAYPDIPGLDSFAGPCFHSARWDHAVELAGKKVGVIGTGSTAAQIVGDITAKVGRMVVFQRTPHWMVELRQKRYSPGWKRLLHAFPVLQKLAYRFYREVLIRTFAAATVGDATMQGRVADACLRNLERNVADPELRRRLTPDYQAACKRLILCSTFYPAISRPNARLITEKIAHITPRGVETTDGRIHELDVLVLATGFDPTAFILPTKVIGEGGRDLEEFWDGAPRALRSVAVPGFPNFWMIEGPTGPVGNFSLISITEHQIDYIVSMLNRMKADGLAAIAASEEAFRDYNAAMRQAVTGTIWVTGGCTSWYIDKTGLPNLYPWPPQQYLKDMHSPDFSEYRLMRNAQGTALQSAA